LVSASKQPENVYVSCDDYAALPAVLQNRGNVEIAVERAEGIGSAYDSGVNVPPAQFCRAHKKEPRPADWTTSLEDIRLSCLNRRRIDLLFLPTRVINVTTAERSKEKLNEHNRFREHQQANTRGEAQGRAQSGCRRFVIVVCLEMATVVFHMYVKYT